MRFSSRRILLPVLIIMLAVTSVGMCGGYNLAGVGAKALAMSGAFRAVADDYSAMYWNPAGLALQNSAFGLEGKLLYPIVWLTPNVPSAYPGYEGYRNGVEQTSSAGGHPAGSLGAVYRINEKTALGLSIFTPSALGAEWENLFTGPPYGYKNTVPYPAKGWFSDLKVIDIHPTVAYNATDKLSLGLGLAVQMGDILLESPKLVPSGAPMPFEHFYVDAQLDGTGWGFGFNLGAIYRLNDQLKLGIAYRGPVTIAVEGKVKQRLILPYSLGMQAASPSQAALFGGGELNAEPDATADFPIPMDAGLGAAYQINDRLLVAFDAVWTNWGDVKDVTVKLDGTGPTGTPAEDTKLVLRYKDTYRFSLGCDYLACTKRNLHLRAGYYHDPTPIPDGSLRPSITDVADKHNISLGFGIPVRKGLQLEGYYERLFSGERSITSTDMDGDGAIDNLAGKWKLQVDTFGFALIYSL